MATTCRRQRQRLWHPDHNLGGAFTNCGGRSHSLHAWIKRGHDSEDSCSARARVLCFVAFLWCVYLSVWLGLMLLFFVSSIRSPFLGLFLVLVSLFTGLYSFLLLLLLLYIITGTPVRHLPCAHGSDGSGSCVNDTVNPKLTLVDFINAKVGLTGSAVPSVP